MAATPKVQTNRSADASLFIAAAAATTNLLTVTGKPPFAPQLVVLYNSTNASIATVNMTDDGGATHTGVVVPANGVMPMYVPIASITLPAAGITALCYWWERGTVPHNQHTVAARN